MDMQLELIVIPVTDIDRAKAFYAEQAGFDVHVDHQPNDDFRIVQMTPPQSGTSIAFGKGISSPDLANVQGLHLVVGDIEAAVADLGARGLEIVGPFHFGEQGQTSGVHPDRADYGSFASFSDPDGNLWLLQEHSGRTGMKLELVVVPTADVERAKQFYEGVVGFAASTDHNPSDDLRIVQLDPPGSPCSITVGKGIPQMAPGTLHGLHLVVADIVAALGELAGRGLDVSEPYHFGMDGSRTSGVDPNRGDYVTFADFTDPDGNTWLIQDVPSRANS